MRYIGKIKNVIHNYTFIDDMLIIIRKSNNQKYIELYDRGLVLLDSIKDNTAYDFHIYNEMLIFTSQDDKNSYTTKILNKKFTSLEKMPFTLHLKGEQNNNFLFCYATVVDNEVYINLNLDTLQIVNTVEINIGLYSSETGYYYGVDKYLFDKYISVNKFDGILAVYKFPNILLWQADVSQIGSYKDYDGEHLGEIKEILNTDDKVIVLTPLKTIAFNLHTGNIVWQAKLDTWQGFGLLQDGYLYTSSNAYINKINVSTGEILYQKRAEPVELGGKKLFMPLSRFVWHDGHLWSVMDTDPILLLKIDPTTGEYSNVINLKELGITRHCDPPKFHNDRMYILDHDHTLYIFETE